VGGVGEGLPELSPALFLSRSRAFLLLLLLLTFVHELTSAAHI